MNDKTALIGATSEVADMGVNEGKKMSKEKRKFFILEDLDAITNRAAEIFTNMAEQEVKRKGVFTVTLSGGSTPKSLYSLLADEEKSFRNRIPWEKIHFFWGDERCVPFEHPDSNYRMVNESLLSKVPVKAEQIHPIMTAGMDVEKASESYGQLLTSFFSLEDGGIPNFDLVLLGMGDDGHTASLFFGSDALNEKRLFVVADRISKFNSHRISLTVPVLNNATSILFLVSGRNKAKVLKDVIHGTKQGLYPVQLIVPVNGKELWLVDRDAGSLLD